MNDWKVYIISDVNSISHTVCEVLLSFFCIGTIAIMVFYRKNGARYIVRLLFLEYLFFVYGLTVIFRQGNGSTLHLMPFWNYASAFKNEDTSVLYEIVMNVVLFVPIGFLLGTQCSRWPQKKQWRVVLLFGIGFSAGIELLQLLFKKGTTELDDVIHNTLGCLSGFLIWRGGSWLVDIIKKRPKIKP